MKEFDDFEENWEDIEESPSYTFLKSMHTFLDKKSYPKRSTRKFIRMAMELVSKKEISQADLDYFIENEDIDKDIVKEMKIKKPSMKSSINSVSDPCGGGGGGRSSC